MPTIHREQIDHHRREREALERRCDEIRHDLGELRERWEGIRDREARDELSREIADMERRLKEHEALARAHGEVEEALISAALADPSSRQEVISNVTNPLPFLHMPLELRAETVTHMAPQDVANLRAANKETKVAVDSAVLTLADWKGFVDVEERPFDPQRVQRDPGKIIALWVADQVKITIGPQLEAYDEHLTDERFVGTYKRLMNGVISADHMNVFPDVLGGPIEVARTIAPHSVAHVQYLRNEGRLELQTGPDIWASLPSNSGMDVWQIITRIATGDVRRKARSSK